MVKRGVAILDGVPVMLTLLKLLLSLLQCWHQGRSSLIIVVVLLDAVGSFTEIDD